MRFPQVASALLSVLILRINVAIDALRCDDADSDHVHFFRCANNQCIGVSNICDNDDDCGDNSDEVMCRTDLFQDNFLVVVEQHGRYLYQIDVDSGAAQRRNGLVVRLLPPRGATSRIPHALALDGTHGIVYWTNNNDGSIRKISLTGRRRSSDPELGRGSAADVHVYQVPRPDSAIVRLSGITVDVVGNKLYYCDDGDKPKIGEFSINSGNDSDQNHRVLFTDNTLRPRSVALYDEQDEQDASSISSRSLFWTDHGTHPSISRLYLRPGSSLTRNTITWRNVYNPQGLSIDIIEKALYWVDGGRIERSDLSGDNRRVIYSDSGESFVGITLSRHYIFVTNSTKRLVRRLDRATNHMTDVLPALTSHLVGVVYYNSTEQLLMQQSMTPSTVVTTRLTSMIGTSRTVATPTSMTSHQRPLNQTLASTIIQDGVGDVDGVAVSLTVTSSSTSRTWSRKDVDTPVSPTSSVMSVSKFPVYNGRDVSHVTSSSRMSDQHSSTAALSHSMIFNSGGTTDVTMVIVVPLVVLIVVMGIVSVVYIRCRTKRVYLNEPFVEFHSRPVNDRQNNAYSYYRSPLGEEGHSSEHHAHSLTCGATASGSSEVFDEARDALLKVVTAAGARPKMAIPNTIPSDNDNDGYMVPSFKPEGNEPGCSHYYNSIQQVEDTYLQPDLHNIYEDI